MDAGEPLQVELLLNTGRDMLTGSDQVTGLFAVRRRQQRQELVVIVLGRDGVLPEEPDGEGRCLFAEALAPTRRNGERDAEYRALHVSHFASVCGQSSSLR